MGPSARTELPHGVDDDGAGYLEQNVGYVEDPNSQTVDMVAKSQICAHPEICKRHVHAVDVVDDVKQKYERKKSVGDSPSGSLPDITQFSRRQSSGSMQIHGVPFAEF
jgi:hypothetical protein